jgi:hypothetical protein
MSKKNEGEVAKDEGKFVLVGAARLELLARVAGSVAAGVVGAPTPSTTSASEVAEISVDVAEAILQKVGL